MVNSPSHPRNIDRECRPPNKDGGEQPPFTHAYVMRVTLKHMDACILRSLEKTVKRMPHLSDNDAATFQLIKTIHSLTKLREMLNSLGAIYDHQ